MALTLTADLRPLLRKIGELKEYAFDKTWPEVLRPEARLLCVELARYTQPFDFGKEAEASGEIAVQRDIYRVFANPSTVYARIFVQNQDAAKGFWRYLKKGDLHQVKLVLAAYLPELIDADIGPFDPALHQAARRNGKVVLKRVSRIVLEGNKLVEYAEDRQKRVGFAKSGWATCARTLGGIRGIPRWAAKGNAPGHVVDRSDDPEAPTIYLNNDIDYTDRVLSVTGQAGAFRDRTYRLEQRIAKAIEHRGKAVVE